MLKVCPVSPHIGAEILGLDVRTLDEPALRILRQAFLDHIVVVVRGQQLDIEAFLTYGALFGTLKAHLVKKSRHLQYPELTVMDSRVLDTKGAEENKAQSVLVKRGAVWHTDLSFDYVTAKATLLYAIKVPSSGGDTLFQNTYAAYDRLTPDLKHRIEGLSAHYQYGGRLKRGVELLDDVDRDRPQAIHPLVSVHPETGRRILFFDGGKIMDIIGLPSAESDALIAQLQAHVQTEGDYRHQWQAGDLVIWDNRCSLHAATGDYPLNERRSMWRATIMEEDYVEREAACLSSVAAAGIRAPEMGCPMKLSCG